MSSIPEFQRKKFASQQVGTAGVDTSSANLFGSLAGAASTISHNQRKEQAAQDKVQAGRDALLKSSVTQSSNAIRLMRLNTESERIRRESKDESDYNDKIADHLLTISGEIDDDEERALFSKSGGDFLVRNQRKVADKFRGENVDKIVNNIDTITDTASEAVDEAFSEGGSPLGIKGLALEEALATSNAMIEAQEGALGIKVVEEQKARNREILARTAIGALIDSDPEQVGDFLDGVEDIFPKDEIDEIRKYAVDLTKAKEAEAKVAKATELNAIGEDFSKRIGNGEDIPETELAQMELETPGAAKYVSAVRRYKASSKKADAKDDPKVLLELTTELHSMSKTRRGKTKIDINTSFEQIASFRAAVMDARSDGNLTASQAKKWFDLTTFEFNEGVDKMFDNVNEVVTSTFLMMEFTEDVLTDDAEINSAKIRLQGDFMDNIAEEEEAVGRRLTPTELLKVREDLEREFVVRQSPVRDRWKLGEVYDIDGGKERVVGYNRAGDAIFDDDLSAKVDEAPEAKK